jgi:hypothetical protein
VQLPEHAIASARVCVSSWRQGPVLVVRELQVDATAAGIQHAHLQTMMRQQCIDGYRWLALIDIDSTTEAALQLSGTDECTKRGCWLAALRVRTNAIQQGLALECAPPATPT